MSAEPLPDALSWPEDVDLYRRICEMDERLIRIEAILLKADKTIGDMADQVKPTLETLADHPLLKALTFGKKK